MLYHAGLNDLVFPPITVAGYLILAGCTGGNAGVDAISSGALVQALEVELVDWDSRLLVARVVGPVGLLTVMLLVWLPGYEWCKLPSSTFKSSSESSSLSGGKTELISSSLLLSLLLSSSWTIFTRFVLELPELTH